MMANLRVGDIEIDGANVTIGGNSMTTAPPAAVDVLGTAHASADPFMAKIRPSGVAMIAVGALVLIVGGLSYALAGPGSFQAYLFQGGLLASMGAGLMTLGFLKRAMARQAINLEARRGADEIAADAKRIQICLATSPGLDNTVERICAASSLGEARVVQALASMRAAGLVKEDVNLDTGDWHYAVHVRELRGEAGASKSLDERLKEMERRNR